MQPGEKLGPYQIVRELGHARAFWHYAARPRGARRLSEEVLLKCQGSHEEGSLEGGSRRRVRFEEAGLGAVVLHPNVARLYETGCIDDLCYLAMELVSGMTLTRMLQRAPLPVPAVLWLGVQLLEALHHAHELVHQGTPLGLLHRNLSTDAVIVTRDGDLKLVDFDYMLPNVGDEWRRPRQTWRFSPEQARGLKLDRRSDVFSAGSLLYEASTGRYPFDSDDEFTMLLALIERPLDPLRAFASCFPQVVEDVILKAMARPLDARFATAAHFRDALVRAAAALDVTMLQGRAALAKCFEETL